LRSGSGSPRNLSREALGGSWHDSRCEGLKFPRTTKVFTFLNELSAENMV
jgi:hypothetical protein